MSKLEKAKEIIKENYKEALCGIYDTMNTAGDEMHYLYDDGELKIFICYGWEYFEVFGLDSKEFSELRKYYHALRRGKQNEQF